MKQERKKKLYLQKDVANTTKKLSDIIQGVNSVFVISYLFSPDAEKEQICFLLLHGAGLISRSDLAVKKKVTQTMNRL